MKRLSLIGCLCVSGLAACTYGIQLDRGGETVHTAWNGVPGGGCRDLGKVTVSVLSRVGPVDRNDIKVRDELEIMARNQAAQMRADTIAPLGDPRDGEQAWEAYQCGGSAPPAAADVPDGSGAPVHDMSTDSPSSYPPPPPDRTAQPAPFSEPAPASTGGAETFPASGSSQ